MHLYYSNPIMSKFEEVYPTIRKLELDGYFERIGYLLHKYYTRVNDGLMPTRAFQVVLCDVLYEKPSLDIITELSKINNSPRKAPV